MTAPLVTIGLPCFNAEDTIARAISSALAQNWSNIELVIVDDISTDRSVEVAERMIGGDQRVRHIRHSRNTGPAGARNTVLAHARGEFVVFFDDDDESRPNRISVQIKTLTDYENRTGARLVACYASGIRRYPNGYTKNLPAIGSRTDGVPNGPGVADYLLFYRRRSDWFYGSGTPTCALMARPRVFAEVGGFDAEFRRVEDAEFAIRLALHGGHFIGAADPLFIQYSTRGTDKAPEKNLEAEQQLAKKNKKYLDSMGRYYYAYNWPKLRYWHFKHRYGRFMLELLSLLARNPVAVVSHLLATGLRRLLHEQRIRQGSDTCD